MGGVHIFNCQVWRSKFIPFQRFNWAKLLPSDPKLSHTADCHTLLLEQIKFISPEFFLRISKSEKYVKRFSCRKKHER